MNTGTATTDGQTQSLAKGAIGTALLHIERAHTGTGDWPTAHARVRDAASAPIIATSDACLYFGAPALAFLLHAAEADGVPRYATARTRIDTAVTALAHRRLDRAHARIDRAEPAAFAEYDLLHGLTGIGAHLLHHDPDDDALGRVLAYLVRLTEPLHVDGHKLPGWWVHHDPQRGASGPFRGGHANLGLAHGITGPLALLAQALRRQIEVDGQHEAIDTICTWLDRWRHPGEAGAWWPQWIRFDGRTDQTGPLRPSWCYGTPGLARAQQLAAIATGNTARQRMAETALADCLADPNQLARVHEPGLCHGWAGLYQTATRAASDALTPAISTHLPFLLDQLTQEKDDTEGFLDGHAGTALTLDTAERGAPPVTEWDACLLIN
ncbi:lanthionine synthetase C family protein [Nocardiopsis quinghaiensis]|uniref:lanthionine synthetase C family protein n=1 Tax=Nocardiopsis quinghaiensis TaxID=464995 RepID=UPI00123A1DE6|nr:lanthionine synthetase C family protein [Nocardiopsis quinghaiensis]